VVAGVPDRAVVAARRAYVWRFVEAAYFRAPRKDTAGGGTVPWSMALPAGAAGGRHGVFGLDTSFTVGSAAQAAAACCWEGRADAAPTMPSSLALAVPASGAH
jgi:hypothetical protein